MDFINIGRMHPARGTKKVQRHKLTALLCAWLCVSVLVSGMVYAEEAAEARAVFTYEDVYTLLKANDAELKRLESEQALIDERKAQLDRDIAKQGTAHDSADSYVAIYVQKLYRPKALEIERQQLDRSVESRVRALRQEALDRCIELGRKRDVLRLRAFERRQAEEGHRRARALLEQGRSTEREVFDAHRAVLEATLREAQAEADASVYLAETNFRMGRPPESDLVLNADIDVKRVPSLTLEDFQALYDETLQRAQETQLLARYKLEVYESHMYNSKPLPESRIRAYGAPSDYIEVRRAAQSADADYQRAKNDSEINAHKAYYRFRQLEIGARIAELAYDSALRAYEAGKLRFKLGQIDAYSRDALYVRMQDAYLTYVSAEKSRYLEAYRVETGKKLRR